MRKIITSIAFAMFGFFLLSEKTMAQTSHVERVKRQNDAYEKWQKKQNWKHNYFEWQKAADQAYEDWAAQSGWNDENADDADDFSTSAISEESDQISDLQSEIAALQQESNTSSIANNQTIQDLQDEIRRLQHANDELTKPTAVSKFKIWAVVVGVAHYRKEHARLRYCDDDAYKIYAFLKSPEGGALPDKQIALLVDEEANGQSIQDKIKQMSQAAGPNDVFMFYFSGHGSKDALLAEDFTENVSGSVTHHFINQQISQTKAKLAVCIIDACHSGNIGVVEPAQSQVIQGVSCLFNPASYNNPTKGIKGTKSIAALAGSTQFYEGLYSTKKGSVYILSSKGEETSLEMSGKRQGIFSYYFIQGLAGKADYNGDNIISVTESFDYTRKKVISATRKAQTPIITGDYAHNMPLAMVR